MLQKTENLLLLCLVSLKFLLYLNTERTGSFITTVQIKIEKCP